MKNYFLDLKNSIDFYLRKYLKFSATGYFEKKDVDIVFSEYDAAREQYLTDKYCFLGVKENLCSKNYLRNLYYLDILDKYLRVKESKALKILDVGSKNWFYVNALYSYFSKFTSNLTLDGVEIDSRRMYSDFHTRKSYADFYRKDLKNTNYYEANLLDINSTYNFITWFFPFVFEEPHMAWGLPVSLFNPKNLLMHAFNLLDKNGLIFILNQGKEEFEAQQNLILSLCLPFEIVGCVESPFSDYSYPHYALLIKKII